MQRVGHVGVVEVEFAAFVLGEVGQCGFIEFGGVGAAVFVGSAERVAERGLGRVDDNMLIRDLRVDIVEQIRSQVGNRAYLIPDRRLSKVINRIGCDLKGDVDQIDICFLGVAVDHVNEAEYAIPAAHVQEGRVVVQFGLNLLEESVVYFAGGVDVGLVEHSYPLTTSDVGVYVVEVDLLKHLLVSLCFFLAAVFLFEEFTSVSG